MKLEDFSCPSCALNGGDARLEAVSAGARCLRCATLYPFAGDVPCFVPDPARYCLSQLRAVEEYLAFSEARQREIGAERRLPHLSALTRERLLLLIRAMDVERALVARLLGKLTVHVERRGADLVPSGPYPARELSVLDCHETTFRDWGWGDPENERARSLLARIVEQVAAQSAQAHAGPAFALGKLGVFGAGACRLAVDVHRTLNPSATYALDINPLPVLIADEIVAGQTVEAYDYPIGPRGVQGAAVLQRLGRQFEIPEGLVLLLGDALRPPFAAGSLDSVLTPWLIDVLPADLRETVTILNRVLRVGGTWLNQGPLRFVGAASRLYTIDEVREIVSEAGFELVAEVTEDLPYFDSPISGQRRVETVYGFAARKRRDVPLMLPAPTEPEWVQNVRLPIPLRPELPALQERFVFSAGTVSLIDGERSIVDLAEALAGELGTTPEALVEPLRGFLSSLLAPR